MTEFRPEPDPSGARRPPSRRPPTAVSTATPPPPKRPRDTVARGSLFPRIAAGILSPILMGAGAMAFGVGAPAWIAVGTVLGVAGVASAGRALNLTLRIAVKRWHNQRTRYVIPPPHKW